MLLAALVCVASSASAIFLLRQADGTERNQRRWAATAGISTGFGIWATHFIAMLAYNPEVIAGFHFALTFASLGAAILLTTTGLLLALRPSEAAPLVGGAVVGLGIAIMHYLGMSAVQFSARLIWSPGYVVASIVLGILFAAAAMRQGVKGTSLASAGGATMLLVLAIVSHHFTGMAAITALPGLVATPAASVISSSSMAVSIAITASAMLLLCLGAAIVSIRARNARYENSQEFAVLVQGITDCAIYMLDAEGRVSSWNPGAEQLKGYTADEAIGRSIADFYTPEDRAADLPAAALRSALSEGKFQAIGWRVRKDKTNFRAQVTIEPVFDAARKLRGFAKITRDITQQQEDQDRLAQLAANLDAALSNMHQGLCLFDADERLVLANDRAGEIFGLTTEDCPVGTPFLETLRLVIERRTGAPASEEMLRETYRRHRAVLNTPGGGMLTAEFRDYSLAIVHRPMAGGGWVSTYEDVTERRRSEARIAHMAMHDSLTSLPNRPHFNERLDLELARAATTGSKIAAIAIDLDRFKEINDTRGHAAGDHVLKTLAQRMSETLADAEFVARFGGDEFAAMKPFDTPAELSDFIQRLEASLCRPLHHGSFEIVPQASLGIAVFPADSGDRDTLLNNADLAMYRAKGALGQHVCYYEPKMDEAARARRTMANDIRIALARNEFTLAYQVQRSLVADNVIGYEALIRWDHPIRGPISPAIFIPVAEESGSILEIGEWVLRTACADAANWDPSHKVAVNLSPVQLSHADLVGLVREVLVTTGLSPSRLELEITESTIIGDKARGLHILRQIKAMGVTIAIDDFGTGYSSLDTLNSFPFDKIKIDRSFLAEAATSRQARAIIRAVLALGRSLDVPVLAEGVETEEQLQLLQSEGCDEAQGYLFGYPEALDARDRGIASAA